MISLFNSKVENVRIDSIDLNNNEYKISRPFIDERLRQSIQSCGILEPPVLLKTNNLYIIIFGHNRLNILKEQKIAGILSIVTDTMDPMDYMEYAILKNYRGEVGPAGKIRFIQIIKNDFNLNKDISIALKNMQIPEDIIKGNEPWDRFRYLPDSLKDYLDSKDIGFKVIRNILRMPDEAISLLSSWITRDMRINIFKGIVDLLIDIIKRDKAVTGLRAIDTDSILDKRKREGMLYREIFKIRYPEYTKLRSGIDAVIDNFRSNGIEVDFPEYFERDEIGIIIRFNKRDEAETIKKKITGINTDQLKDLLEKL
jgi:hypothetical protein